MNTPGIDRELVGKLPHFMERVDATVSTKIVDGYVRVETILGKTVLSGINE